MRTEVVRCGLAPRPGLFSLYVNDMPTPSDHIELPIITDDTSVTETSHCQTRLVSCVEIAQQLRALVTRLEDRHRRLEQHCGTPL